MHVSCHILLILKVGKQTIICFILYWRLMWSEYCHQILKVSSCIGPGYMEWILAPDFEGRQSNYHLFHTVLALDMEWILAPLYWNTIMVQRIVALCHITIGPFNLDIWLWSIVIGKMMKSHIQTHKIWRLMYASVSCLDLMVS